MDTDSLWLTAPRAATDTGDLPKETDVVIAGGGLLGVMCAYWLARAGSTVVLLERHAMASGATGRNSGLVIPTTAEPYDQAVGRLGAPVAMAIRQLAVDGAHLLGQVIEQERISCMYRSAGFLQLAIDADEADRCSAEIKAAHEHSFEATWLDRDALGPRLGTRLRDTIPGAMLLPGATVNSVAVVDGIGAAARRYGARIFTGAAVTAVRRADGKTLVETTRGQIRARVVVAAINAWLADLVPSLRYVIRSVQGQLIATHPMPPMFACGMAAQITSHGEYWQQMPDGTILLGGCRAAAAPPADPAAQLAQPEVHQALLGVLPALFPVLRQISVQRGWAGAMAFTADANPIVDEIDESFWAIGGFSGHGMPFGASIGKLLATHLSSGSPLASLTHLRLDRPSLLDADGGRRL